ncbi:MAG: putative lipid II flippase FtsW [Patescibacteria group bacterium]
MKLFANQSPTTKPDYFFLGSFSVLVLLGLIILSSAGTAIGLQKFNDSYHFVKHQFFYGFLPGIFLFLLCYKINYHFWKKLMIPSLFFSIFLLLLVFIPGIGAEFGTAKSWIHIFGFSFQPAEIVKLSFLVYLSAWLEKRGQTGVKDLYYGFLPFVFLLGLISILMLLQPDMGTLSVIIFMCLAVFFYSGARFKHVFFLLCAGVASIYLMIIKSPYRAARLTTFLHPELDPQGIGYHINQAFLAIGSGGIIGLGFGHSRQKHLYLPEVTGDSIFAIFAEEMGFIFSTLLILLFIFFIYKGLKIAQKAPDLFGKLLATGIISWIGFQTFFNISSMVGLSPMTGIPLPFISYGGTALAILMGACGIIGNISKNTEKI